MPKTAAVPTTSASGIKSIAGMALLTVGVLATVGTALGFFGSLWWAFDVMSGYRVQMGLILAIVAVLYGLFYARATAVVFAVAAAANAFLVLPLFLQSPPAAAGLADLTVVSYDTERSTTDVGSVVDWIEDQTADVIFLFETDAEWAQRIEERAIPYSVYFAHTEDRVYGITMLSRVDVDAETLAAGPTAEPVLRARTRLGQDEVVIYASRATRATSETEAELRDETLATVGGWAADEVKPVVVVGPLNTSQWSYAFQDLKSEANLIDSMAGYGFQPSYRADMWLGFRVPADQALYSEHLTTKHRAIGPTLGSAHLPLEVTFAMAVR